jgi:toxin YoeB
MKIVFAEEAWEDYLYWQTTNEKILRRVHDLIKDVSRNPFQGIGKPEPLRYAQAGFWSRRITEEHRMVYRMDGDRLLLAQLRYHYER